MSNIITTVPPGLEDGVGYFTNGAIPGGVGDFVNSSGINYGGFQFSNCPQLTSLSFPNLTKVGTIPSNSGAGMFFSLNANLASFSAPNLQKVIGSLAFVGHPLLGAISLPALQTVGVGGSFAFAFELATVAAVSAPALTHVGQLIVGGSANITLPALTTIDGTLSTTLDAGSPTLTSLSLAALVSCDQISPSSLTSLVTFSVPSLVPHNTMVIQIIGAALNATSVNQILARCVANAAYVSGTINLSGGTSSPPTGQGATDKATLIGRGVSVTTN